MFSVLLWRRFTVKLGETWNKGKSRINKKPPEGNVIYISRDTRKVSSAVTLPVRIHADLSFDCDVLPRAQAFQYTAFVREALE